MKISIIAPAILLLLLVFCNQQPSGPTSKQVQQAKEDRIKSNFKILIEDGWNQGDMEQFNTISVENYTRKLNGITVASHRNELEANMKVFLTGFPDCRVTVDQIILKDTNLVAHWTFTGTNTGIFGESPPTGKKVNVTGCSSLQFNENGKITQEAVYYNELALLQQLGYTLNAPVVE